MAGSLFRLPALVLACAVVTTVGAVSAGDEAAAAARPSSAATKPPAPVVWTPPASVDRTPTGTTPTASWSPGVRTGTGPGTTSAAPATAAIAAGSLGAQADVAGGPPAAAGLGVESFYGLETFGLDNAAGLQAQVNLANGNLVVHGTDLKINAPGLNLRLDRFYNSQSTGSGAFGNHAVLSTGEDVGLEFSTNTVTFSGPSGFTAAFTGAGPTYTAPAGINASLVKNADGSYAMTYNKSGEKLSFTVFFRGFSILSS